MTIQEIKAKAQEKFGKTCEKVVNFFENPTVQMVTVAIASSVVTGIVVHFIDDNSQEVDTCDLIIQEARKNGTYAYYMMDKNNNPINIESSIICNSETKSPTVDAVKGLLTVTSAAAGLLTKENEELRFRNAGPYMEVRVAEYKTLE